MREDIKRELDAQAVLAFKKEIAAQMVIDIKEAAEGKLDGTPDAMLNAILVQLLHAVPQKDIDRLVKALRTKDEDWKKFSEETVRAFKKEMAKW